MKAHNVYATIWVAWIIMFFVVELSALWSGHSEWTLSEFTWRIEKLKGAWTFMRYVITAFCLWLSGHLVLGWWR